MQVHPAADIFPMLDAPQLRVLADAIEESGLRESIKTLEGQILDGRNRLAACKLAGVEPRFEEAKDVGDPVRYVVNLNLHRRHLSESQRAMAAARAANMTVGRSETNASIEAISQPAAAALLNVSRSGAQRAIKVLDRGAPGLPEMVDRAQVPVSVAAKLAALPMAAQVAAVAAGPEAVKEAAKPHVTHASGDQEWYTPAQIIEAARAAMGSIDLDPASCEEANAVVQAGRYYTKEDDGLSQEWSGNVWLNPPYAAQMMHAFADRLSDAITSGDCAQATILVNNATETRWFQKMASVASAICFPTGRVKFWHPDTTKGSTPLQGQAVIYCGGNADFFADEFSPIGLVLVTR